jgi:tetratricopeptide (TPR) repeat protein
MALDAAFDHEANKEIGLTLLNTDDVEEATEAILEALRASSACSHCWGLLARAYEQLYGKDRVAEMLRRVQVSQDGDSAEIIAFRGAALEQIDPDEALADLSRALDIDPDFSWARAHRGTLLSRAFKRYDEALVDLNEAAARESHVPYVFGQRGTVYWLMGETDSAIRDFDKVIDLDPANFWAYAQRAGVNAQLGRLGEALEDFNEALERNPKAPRTRVRRGRVLYLMERNKEALADFEAASALDPDTVKEVLNDFGLLLTYEGRLEDAIARYQQVLEVSGGRPDALYNLAVARARLLGSEQVRADIAKAEAIFSEDLVEPKSDSARGTALYGLGGLAAVAGNDSRALDLLEQAVRLSDQAAWWARHDIAWDTVRSDPRFQQVLKDNDGAAGDSAT